MLFQFSATLYDELAAGSSWLSATSCAARAVRDAIGDDDVFGWGTFMFLLGWQ